MPRAKAKVLTKVCARCGAEFTVPDKKNYREKLYCTRACSNAATAKQRAASVRALEQYQAPICPCGKEVSPPPGRNYVYGKKYCSPECRRKYARHRPADPNNYITFKCDTCDAKVTRRKNYSQSISGRRFCSNECAAKHTKQVRHYVLREQDMVVDSSWEVLVVGLLAYLKISTDRVDRATAVEWSENHWYAPDLYLPALNVWVEIKGREGTNDPAKWHAWTAQRGVLMVINQENMPALLRAAADGRTAFLDACGLARITKA